MQNQFETTGDVQRRAAAAIRALKSATPQVERDAALERALLTSPCPHPLFDMPNHTVEHCLKAGVCGCDNRDALKRSGA